MGIGENLDLSKDQHLMSIRVDNRCIGHVEITNGEITTCGEVGENTYENFVALIYGLQGFGIEIDNFFF